RLAHTESERVARTLAAWSVTSSATIAALTALWGLLAAVIDPRAAIALAGVLLLATPLLLPRSQPPCKMQRKRHSGCGKARLARVDRATVMKMGEFSRGCNTSCCKLALTGT